MIIKRKTIDIKKFKKRVIEEFSKLYANYYEKNKLNNILKIWRKYCDTINKSVTVITKTKKLKGKAIGVDENCRLLLKIKNNKIIKIIEGDIKVRY
jgi:biotin-(acetyl-CoA carboxylase) ligase